jgi:hypothetical protein
MNCGNCGNELEKDQDGYKYYEVKKEGEIQKLCDVCIDKELDGKDIKELKRLSP